MTAAERRTLSVLSFNVALQDVRLLGRSVWRPLGHVEERLDALSRALIEHASDIVCLQECFHRPLQDRLVAALGGAYPQVAGLARRGFKLRIGSELPVLARHPIEDARFVRFHTAQPEERLFASMGFVIARVRLPSSGHVHVVNLHASAGGIGASHPESPRAEAIRSRQIAQIVEAVRGIGPVVLVGDLNAGPEASPTGYGQVLDAGFQDAFASAGGQGVSWDPGNLLIRASGGDPLHPQRIDHVFINAAARGVLRPSSARIVLDEARATLTDGRRVPISDHYAVEVVFEA